MKSLSEALRTCVFVLGMAAMLAACTSSEQDPVTVFMVGDSTMAEKKDPENNPERGWGMALPGVFNDKVTVANYAVNGRSTRSFIDEGRWDTIIRKVAPGDYVIIQFGHNDSKYKDPRRYTNPWTAYRSNLEKFVQETRARSAHPVICSSIARRTFNEFGTLVDTHGPYPFVARMVARELKVPFLDLQQKTEDWITDLGPEDSKAYFMHLEPGEWDRFPEGREDDTHLRKEGAYAVSVFAAEELRDQQVPLAGYLKPGLFSE